MAGHCIQDRREVHVDAYAAKFLPPHVAASARSFAAPEDAWTRAVGMVEKPGPERTWTYPPSWSVATKGVPRRLWRQRPCLSGKTQGTPSGQFRPCCVR